MIGNTDVRTRRMQDSMSMRKIYRVPNGYGRRSFIYIYIYNQLDVLETLKIETKIVIKLIKLTIFVKEIFQEG